MNRSSFVFVEFLRLFRFPSFDDRFFVIFISWVLGRTTFYVAQTTFFLVAQMMSKFWMKSLNASTCEKLKTIWWWLIRHLLQYTLSLVDGGKLIVCIQLYSLHYETEHSLLENATNKQIAVENFQKTNKLQIIRKQHILIIVSKFQIFFSSLFRFKTSKTQLIVNKRKEKNIVVRK